VNRQSVSCSWVREHLLEIFDGTISGEDRHRLSDHLDGCAACADMLSEAMFDAGQAPRKDSEESLRRILAATSGEPCTDALERIVSIETTIPESDELLTGHLEHCPICRRKADVWAWVRAELHAMAELDVPASLTAAVLGRTSRVEREAGWRDWIRSLGESLVRRPRAALELGYLFALPFMLLFHPAAVPGHFMETRMTHVSEFTSLAQDEAVLAAAGLGRAVDEKTRSLRSRLAQGWVDSIQTVDQFYCEIRDVSGAVKTEVKLAATACSTGQFDRGIRHAGAAWNAIKSFDPEAESSGTTEGGTHGTE